MKTIAILMLCTLLSACTTPQQIAAADDAKCKSYGFKPGTDAYGHCRLQIDQTRAFIRSQPDTCTKFGNTVSCY